MKPKMIAKICVDIGMTIALLLLMPYELVGQAAHEWIGIGNFCAGLHDWFHGQRSHSFPPCSFFSADQRWTFFWKKPAHACILLGLCSVVLTSGSALEHDDRNGEKSGKETICCPYMDTAYPVIGDCRVWCVRLCKTGNRELYASENTVCILQF